MKKKDTSSFRKKQFKLYINGELWHRVKNLQGSGPDDPVYILDKETGEVIFGDGINGRRLPTGAAIMARYHSTEEPVEVRLKRSDIGPTKDQVLWTVIRKSTDAISFKKHFEKNFILKKN